MKTLTFSQPNCLSCSALLKTGNFPCETSYCTGFKGKKKKRFPRGGPKKTVPTWCPKQISPPVCRIYGFADQNTAMLDYLLHQETETTVKGYAYPLAHRYRFKETYPLGITAKQFWSRLQEETLMSIFPDYHFNYGEILEIDDGFKPHFFYYSGEGIFLYAPIFSADGIRPKKQSKPHAQNGSNK